MMFKTIFLLPFATFSIAIAYPIGDTSNDLPPTELLYEMLPFMGQQLFGEKCIIECADAFGESIDR